MDEQVLESLLRLSRSMAETRTLKPLLDYAMDEAMRLIGAKRGYVVLLNADGSLHFHVIRGSHRDGTPLDEEDEISPSILQEVVNTKQSLIVNDASKDPRCKTATSVVMLGLRSVMCVPLMAHGETLGIIYVENRTAVDCFDDDDLALLTLFANQAAVSIENAILNDLLESRIAERTQELEAARAQLEHD